MKGFLERCGATFVVVLFFSVILFLTVSIGCICLSFMGNLLNFAWDITWFPEDMQWVKDVTDGLIKWWVRICSIAAIPTLFIIQYKKL